MSLANGTRLGPYEIVGALGAGGMGEVYKARDTRLERAVAIKVLAEPLASDPQFGERFEREAKAISRLNHPHICTLYDVGEESGVPYLVMEYLEGETLADRLMKGALPIDQALRHAIEIAGALDTAHGAGITHRDLKPGNVMLTRSGAKLLDFGLAKTRGPAVAGAGLSMLPTTPPTLTAQGTILGTLHYMAPEQLEGMEADARTDIFAFGAIVYEMVTGRRCFEGKSHASLIAAIMHVEPPPISTLQPLVPPALDRIVQICLAKDPEDRWQSARDLVRELKWIAESASALGGPGASHTGPAPVTTPLTRRERLAWMLVSVVATALVAALAFGAMTFGRGEPEDTRVYRASIDLPADTRFGQMPPVARLALSPDGRRLAYVAIAADGRSQLWIRPLDGLAAEPLAGTDGASSPFWSPDSQFVAFYMQAQGTLKKIAAAGGPPLIVCNLPTGAFPGGGTWNRDGSILLGQGTTIHRVSASGGELSSVSALDRELGETRHVSPQFLPDGRHFLYFALGRHEGGVAQVNAANGIYLASLDSSQRTLLVPMGSNAQYAEGHLLFLREQTLMAQPFDSERLALRGEAVPIVEGVLIGGQAAGPGASSGGFSVSDTGVLIYQTGAVAPRSQLLWFDRAGKQLGILGDASSYTAVALSPDGTRVAVSSLDAAGVSGTENSNIWRYDITRGVRTRLTFGDGREGVPIWSPDGNRIAFLASRGAGSGELHDKAASGAGEEALLLSGTRGIPSSWSPDGRFILYVEITGSGTRADDLWVLPLTGDRKPFRFTHTPSREFQGRFSPDGRWIAYALSESETSNVFVAPFPSASSKWQISTTGGFDPVWRADGAEIYYLAPDNKVMAAAVDSRGSSFEIGAVRVLFEAARIRPGRYQYDVSPDGQRFLVNTLVDSTTSGMTLVVNWQATLKK